ncbi:hypothetical protein [Sphingomonas jatrophae]|uniref:Uncharacterized protein n=1 Tax=Sphingomonas jatrophae TaxID=1166337 RepID=A0A1I6LQI1_9SPHN|nr:hypothetical protein [Sphingomonas jatrophae]SFS05767.1 hypothetical protein SAMN05192580_3138 [Sphingomonas jatrophae]
MGPALYVIAILGCGDSEAACREVRRIDRAYATAAACSAASATVLATQADLDFPVVQAECRPATALAAMTPRPRG